MFEKVFSLFLLRVILRHCSVRGAMRCAAAAVYLCVSSFRVLHVLVGGVKTTQ